MEARIYHKNYWNNSILLWLLGLLVSCVQNKITYDELPIDKGSTNIPYVKMKIEFQDSVYNAIVEEQFAHSTYSRFSQSCDSKKITTKKDLYRVLENENLKIDLKTFQLLRDTIGAFVTPQHRIDSIYNRDMTSLFNLYGSVMFLNNSLSYDEEKYLISLLFENGIYVVSDCETGYLFLAN